MLGVAATLALWGTIISGPPIGTLAAGSIAVVSGSAWAWGDNGFGQLGNGTTTNSSTPIAVSLPGGTTVTAIAGGGYHSLALTSSGQVLAWGYNGYGQLGNGTTTNSSTPVAVSLPSGTTVTAIAGGRFHSLALTSTGQVLAWGYNGNGQLGNGTTTSSNIPVAVSLPSGTTVTAIAGGGQPQPGADLDRPGPGLGLQRRRRAGQRHHHQQQHPGCGQPALGDHRHRHRRRRTAQPGADLDRPGPGLGLQLRRPAGQRHHHHRLL